MALHTLESGAPIPTDHYVAVISDCALRLSERPPCFLVHVGTPQIFEGEHLHGVTGYELLRAKHKLALLFKLANCVRGARCDDSLRLRPLYKGVAAMQQAFDLQLRVSDLARRLACDETTIRRWFRDVGPLRIEELLQWIRMHRVAQCLLGGRTAEATAAMLGFSHVQVMRRSMLRVAGTHLHVLHTEDGFEAFIQKISKALD